MALYRLTKGNILKVLSSLRINRVSIILSNILCAQDEIRNIQEHHTLLVGMMIKCHECFHDRLTYKCHVWQ
jgi:hypothetical protein